MPPPPADADEGPFGSLSLEHSSTVDKVAEELRRALFEGELDPGTALREVALAEAMGVARSTVREALGTLVAEGLATREPHRGVQVASLDVAAVRDVVRARAVVEAAGVRRWAEADEGAREEVRRSVAAFASVAQDAGTSAELTAAHLVIHQAFVGLAGSARLSALAESLSAEVRLGLARVDRIRRNAEEQVHSHQRIVDRLEAGDVEGAAADLVDHLADAEESMLDALEVTPVGPGADPAGLPDFQEDLAGSRGRRHL